MCVSCGVYVDDRGPDGPVRCESCRAQAIEDQERRERRRIIGSQPSVCQYCNGAFTGRRLGHRYCSTACRCAAWRARHDAALV